MNCGRTKRYSEVTNSVFAVFPCLEPSGLLLQLLAARALGCGSLQRKTVCVLSIPSSSYDILSSWGTVVRTRERDREKYQIQLPVFKEQAEDMKGDTKCNFCANFYLSIATVINQHF